MKKKPAITLIRGNKPKLKLVTRSTKCWSCMSKIEKNDKVFEVPGSTLRNANGNYYKANKAKFCIECMKTNIARTEKDLDKIKKMVS
jgi:hypothetical protein